MQIYIFTNSKYGAANRDLFHLNVLPIGLVNKLGGNNGENSISDI